MRTVSIRLVDLMKAMIPIGFMGENEHTRVIIDCKKIFDEYPTAVPALTVKPPVGDPYPAVTVRDGDIVMWDVIDSDLANMGFGEVQFTFTVDNIVVKSFIGGIKVERSLIPNGTAPKPIDDWLAAANTALNEIPEKIAEGLETAMDEITADAETLEPGSSATASYDADTKKLTIGVPKGADGIDGYSPSASVEKTGAVAIIAITDKDGTTTADIHDGQDGISPTVVVTDITGGHNVSITDASGTQTFDVMDGQDGISAYVHIKWSENQPTKDSDMKTLPDAWIGIYSGTSPTPPTSYTSYLWYKYKGEDGVDGYSPSASVAKSGITSTITITDKSGTTTAEVSDGQDGEDGYSPTATVTKSGKVATITITDKNGTTQETVSDGADADPTTIIDDTSTAQNKVWSASKSNDLLSALNSVEEDIGTVPTGKTVEGQIGDIADAFDYLTSNGRKVLFTNSPSGTKQKDYETGINLPAGDYLFTADSIVSSDTDSTVCRVLFMNGSSTVLSSNANRGSNISTNIKLNSSCNKIIFYASDNASHSAGDTFTFTNVVIGKYVSVTDVQVNGTSVLSNGVANVPIADSNNPGAVKINSSYGIKVLSSGVVQTNRADLSTVKSGTNQYSPIVPYVQDSATFYGLAKAAGDTSQSSSSNAVGTYTEDAKSKISDMLNAPVSVSGSTPSITAKSGIRYVCGEVSTLSVTLPSSGDVEIIFESGSTATVLTITPPSGVTAVKWPSWFDPTSLDASCTYDMIITDGKYGVVTAWA